MRPCPPALDRTDADIKAKGNKTHRDKKEGIKGGSFQNEDR